MSDEPRTIERSGVHVVDSTDPAIRSGAADQAEAYAALLSHWADSDPEEDARDWQRVKAQLQETRRMIGQRLLFSE